MVITRAIVIVWTGIFACMGCSSLNGLVDPTQLIRGTIEGAYYTSPGGDFRIMMPHAEGTVGYFDMNIKEKIIHNAGSTTTFVSFEPSKPDANVYHIRVTVPHEGRSTSPTTFYDQAVESRSSIIAEAESAYDALLSKFHSEKFSLNDRETLYVAYRQPIPSKNSKESAPNQVRYHTLYFVDYAQADAGFWVEIPSRPWTPERELAHRIERREVPSVNRFVSSLEFLTPRSHEAIQPVTVSPLDDTSAEELLETLMEAVPDEKVDRDDPQTVAPAK